MLIGAMNHPGNDPVNEIEWIAGLGLDFIDLTLEPPEAASWRVDPRAIRAALERHRLQVIGHTAFYLPLASAFREIRQAAVTAVNRCLEVFAEIGASWVNVHPDRYTPMHGRAFFIQGNLESLSQLLLCARKYGAGLMIENLPGDFNSVEQLGELLDPLPELGLHLDIGHCNLLSPYNRSGEILRAYGSRLRHVHLHDNRGGHEDLHMPLGTGTVDVPRAVRDLKACGYDGTITLEVFTPDRHYLRYSRDLLRQLWDES